MFVFDLPLWRVRFPVFSGVPDELVQAIRLEVPLYFNPENVPADQQTPLYNLALAHLVSLSAPIAGSAASQGLVGRVTTASEGSVSVSLDAGPATSATQAFWLQTTYGQLFWTMTAQYRRFRYRTGFPRYARQRRNNPIA